MLLKSIKICENLSENEEFNEKIKKSLDLLLNVQMKSGNFPSSYGKEGDKLLHFCHGAPGAIPLMLTAYEIYREDKYLASAKKAGKLIWRRGILK